MARTKKPARRKRGGPEHEIPEPPDNIILVDKIKKTRMISIKNDLPPNTGDPVLVYDKNIGFEVCISAIARQHILLETEDMKKGYYRVICWRPL